MKTKNSIFIAVLAVVLFIVGIILAYTHGNMFSAGDYAMNYFAAGDFAVGIFSAGKFSVGIFSVGIFSVGLFSIGIFNIALYGLGFFILAWVKKYPKFTLSETSGSNPD